MRAFDNLVVCVTGGSRGIGRATALACARAGSDVFTCARSPEGLRTLVEEFEGAGSLVAQTADVTRPGEVRALFDRIREEHGRLDVLVQNAGVLGPRRPIEEVELEAWRETLEVNLDGVFIVAKEAIPLLRSAREAVVLNVSSSVGREGRGEWGPYAVSKHGVEGLTGTLADELRDDGAAVVSVNPGGTATEMRAEAYPDEDPSTLPSSEEIAETFRLLIERVGPEASGRRYDARELLDLTDRLGADESLRVPFVSD